MIPTGLRHCYRAFSEPARRDHDALVRLHVVQLCRKLSDAVYVDRPAFVAALNDDEDAIARDVRPDRHVELASDLRFATHHLLVWCDNRSRGRELLMHRVDDLFKALPLRVWLRWRGHVLSSHRSVPGYHHPG